MDNILLPPKTIFQDIKRYIIGETSFSSSTMEDRFLTQLSWVWTEVKVVDDEEKKVKFISRYVSQEAYNHMKEVMWKNKGITDDIDFFIQASEHYWNSELRHEHVVPRQIFKNTLKYYRKIYNEHPEEINFEKLEILLEEKFFACILTKDENSRLDKENKYYPTEGAIINEEMDPWLRYRRFNMSQMIEENKIIIKEFEFNLKEKNRWKPEVVRDVDLS